MSELGSSAKVLTEVQARFSTLTSEDGRFQSLPVKIVVLVSAAVELDAIPLPSNENSLVYNEIARTTKFTKTGGFKIGETRYGTGKGKRMKARDALVTLYNESLKSVNEMLAEKERLRAEAERLRVKKERLRVEKEKKRLHTALESFGNRLEGTRLTEEQRQARMAVFKANGGKLVCQSKSKGCCNPPALLCDYILCGHCCKAPDCSRHGKRCGFSLGSVESKSKEEKAVESKSKEEKAEEAKEAGKIIAERAMMKKKEEEKNE
jgi:hypothetical protein